MKKNHFTPKHPRAYLVGRISLVSGLRHVLTAWQIEGCVSSVSYRRL